MKRFWVSFVLFVLAACQSSPGSPPSNPANPASPTLTLTPASVNVNAGDAPVTFVATVQNSTETVTWIYSGTGSVTPTSGPATSYTPPSSVANVQSESLTAVLGATGVSATAPIAVYPSDETPPSEPPPAPPPTEPNPPTDPTDATDPTTPDPTDPTTPDPTTPNPTDPTNPDPTTYTLTVTPPTNGYITSADGDAGDGINCGNGVTDCTAAYSEGATALLSATPDEGRNVESWGGDCSGNTGNVPCTLVMDSDKTASVRILPYYLTINVQSGYGIVNVLSSTGSPIFQCYPGDSPCRREFYDETAVTLTAPSGTYAQFQGWQGACSGADICSLTIDRDHEVTAVFMDTPPQ